MSNFLFLKKNNPDLFNIISQAENLFRDEYFEQSIVQIRRFAENLCRDLLQDKAESDDTFDDMINKIKDNSFGNTRMKEFSDDLYFIKKQGNSSVHSSSSVQDGKVALECLERAFEISIFHFNIKNGYDSELDKAVFSEELLMTGKKTGKKSSPILKDEYKEKLNEVRTETSKSKTKKAKKQKIEIKNDESGKNTDVIAIFLTLIIVAFSVLVYSLKLIEDNTHFLKSYGNNVKIAPHEILK